MKKVNEDYKIRLRELFSDILYNNNNVEESVHSEIGDIYLNNVPKTLFKYYSGDSGDSGDWRDLNNVINNQMWYSSPDNFNDPFDCDINTNFEKCLKEVIDNNNSSTSIEDLKSEISKDINKYNNELLGLKSKTGVACFSEVYDSILMWGHYANNHKGFVAEYNVFEFNDELLFTLVPVIYSDKFAEIETLFSGMHMSDLVNKSLTTKSIDWLYEKEWRIIRDDQACGSSWTKSGAILQSIKPSAIYLGINSSTELEERFKEYCLDQDVQLYKMEKSKVDYSLNRKKYR